MGEISTAEAGDGSVTVQSPQSDPTPKSDSDKESETTEPKSKQKPLKQKPRVIKAPETGAQGRVKTQWDNPKADPNLRAHIGEDPTGESNVID